jgi:hypothetical protein
MPEGDAMTTETNLEVAGSALAAYEQPRAVRLGHSPDGTGGGLACADPGSGALGDCSTGFGASVDCNSNGLTADEYCEPAGSDPGYQ